MSIAAIIPAHNEEKTIAVVLRVIRAVPCIDEIIVVNDGSTDRTGDIARRARVTVIDLPRNIGKGEAMRIGVLATKADVIFFSDADLIGLRTDHITSILDPVLRGDAVMCIGLRDRWKNLGAMIPKIDPLFAIGGERAAHRDVFEAMPGKYFKKFEVETAMNHYCLHHKLPVRYATLDGVDQMIKEQKYGLIDGFWRRLRMIGQIARRRIIFLFEKRGRS